MEIFLIVFGILILLIFLFCITNVKVYVEFDNVALNNVLKVKAYIFSKLLVFGFKREIKSEGKKQSIKEKISMVIEYLIKSKADPIDFAKKEIKKSDSLPDMVKRFDFSKIYLETMNLNLCLDLNNAAISAIGTGAVNAIMSIVLAKYADNILGPVDYKVFPGYSGNGVKVEVSAKARVKGIELIKVLFSKGGK